MKRPVPETAQISALEEADRLIAEGDRAEAEGRLPDACERYRTAVEKAPAYGRAWLNLGVALEASGDSEGAFAAYESATAADPQDPFASYNLGKALYMRGSFKRAEEMLRRAVQCKDRFPEAHVVLASVYEAEGKLAAAADALKVALALKPDWAGALFNYGALLQSLGRFSEAEDALTRATAFDPANGEGWFLLGNLLVAHEDKLDRAIRCYRSAAEISPGSPEVHHNLGNALSRLGRWDDAFACYKKAVDLNPDFADAYIGLGNVLKQRNEVDAAIDWYRKALTVRPDSTEAHCNLAAALRDEDRFSDSLHHLKQAIRLSPESAEVRWLHAMCQIPAIYETSDEPERFRSSFSLALEELDGWFGTAQLANGVSALGNQQPFYLAYQEQNNRKLLQRHGSLCVRIMSHWFQQQGFAGVTPSRDANREIRVGFVSKHFFDHPVWQAIVKGWVRNLNREQYPICAFHLGTENDAETQTAKACAAHFEQGQRSLKQWVETILRERPDVLIYPEIGMDALTLKLASLRLAPVQAATWGHPDTTGLETIDYYLSAEDLEPLDAHHNYTERLIRLPHLGCWFQRTPMNPVPPDLDRFGVDARHPVLLCPGTPFKYAPQNDWVLAEIARRVGRCTFVFFTYNVSNMSEKLRHRLNNVFGEMGLRFNDYVTFIPWQSRPAFYGWLKRADVFLDTIGFSGFNTAMQAIECGTPIVTKDGRFMRGRLASGILNRMGLTELVAQSEENYIDLAVRLAADKQYRTQMRGRIEASRAILFEDPYPIRGLETFLSEVSGRH